MTFSIILPILVIILLLIEALLHRRWVTTIPLRIHVNGTRGKSTVTRYIAAGLATDGRRTLAKITGDAPLLILPDGTFKPIRRLGKARVQEQLRIIYQGYRLKVDSLVVECMSIADELQIVDRNFIQPQITVLTNILDDHREHFPAGIEDYVTAICGALPRNGIIITNERTWLPQITAAAAVRNSRVVIPDKIDATDLPAGMFPDNLVLAVQACVEAGVARDSARFAIINQMDLTETPVREYIFKGRRLTFIDGFSVNDTSSAARFSEYWRERLAFPARRMVLLNTRNDRPQRSRQFIDWIIDSNQFGGIILTGNHCNASQRLLKQTDWPSTKLHTWPGRDPIDHARLQCEHWLTEDTVLIGFGNSVGSRDRIVGGLDNWLGRGNV